ncbi:Mss4-like protein [Chaetomium fimeti]|uniref:Mss4-like protein n=1 Tax=Chaetomium fimeti TaxID=1854472 RepID=A0AAE0HF79_9PEZI|nr:Mss4-like protein [Chaetomium fimeti]
MAPSFPTPKFITGGCLCNSLRYRVDFPADHDFKASSSHCQCTQCRRQGGGLFFSSHGVSPASVHFKFTSPTTTLKTYRSSTKGERVICSECGSWIYWRPISEEQEDYLSFTVGTVDPLYLFGEGADGVEVPKEGFGYALANGEGGCWFAENEIKGITDCMTILANKK